MPCKMAFSQTSEHSTSLHVPLSTTSLVKQNPTRTSSGVEKLLIMMHQRKYRGYAAIPVSGMASNPGSRLDQVLHGRFLSPDSGESAYGGRNGFPLRPEYSLPVSQEEKRVSHIVRSGLPIDRGEERKEWPKFF
jgi:hypothetical protein